MFYFHINSFEMIKFSKLSIFLFSFFIGLSVQAQDVLVLELFDDSTLGQFSEFSVTGDGEKWRAGDFGERFFATMNGFNGAINENVDWLISPALDMDVYDDEVLRFENATNFDGPDLELLVSTDYAGSGDPTSATWMDMTSSANWSPGGYEYVSSGDIDLSSITGTAYVAFKYTSSPEVQGKVYQIDSFAVTATTLSTGIFDAEEVAVISAPYVSNNKLIFSVIEASLDVHIALSTIDGNIMPKLSNNKVSGDVQLPIGDLPSGIYVLIVSSEDSVRSYKFVK